MASATIAMDLRRQCSRCSGGNKYGGFSLFGCDRGCDLSCDRLIRSDHSLPRHSLVCFSPFPPDSPWSLPGPQCSCRG